MLFGNILAMDDQTLLVVAFNATVTLLVLAVIYRPLVIESVDPLFLRTVSRAGGPAHLAFLALVVINLVNGFQALGTLLAVGLMILPAGIARFWSRDLTVMICIAVVAAAVSGYAGLVLSFQTRVPSGPAIILVASALYMVSVLFGRVGGVVRQMFPGPASGSVTAMRFLLLFALLLIASPLHAAGRLNVVASFSILGDFVRNVGGDRINLTTLVGADSDVHVYTPAPSDAKRIADAKLVIVNGLGLEGWLPRLVQSSGAKAQVVTASAGIAPLKLGSAADPHGWQSVPNAKIYVTGIADALAAADPDDAEFFRAQTKAYLEKLENARPRGPRGPGQNPAGAAQGDFDP
ncbi:hypothetical protein ACVWYI_007595 [Bradyrhizobium sp. LB13.1]